MSDPKRCRVTLYQKNQTFEHKIRKGMGFQAFTEPQGWPIEYDCRKADCGICIIKVKSGSNSLSKKTLPEKDFLEAMHADDDERLACQCRIFGDVEIEQEF